MIFLAFLLPLALYLLLLGTFHRRPTPVLLSGTWDFIALLLAASGFLLFTGPALITSLSFRWRLFWLFGRPVGDPVENTWYFLAAGYFGVVVLGSVWRFWSVRGQTAVYNADPYQVHEALETACTHLGMTPQRTGHLYVFRDPTPQPAQPQDAAADAHGAVTTARPETVRRSATGPDPLPAEGEPVTLEVDAFAPLRHVTLTWEPAVTPLRQDFEDELERLLAESPTPASDLGGTLFLLGVLLLTLALGGSVALVILRMVG